MKTLSLAVIDVTYLRIVPALLILTVTSAAAQEPDPKEDPQRFEDETTISATRTATRLEDQPMRVEVLEREEIEEKISHDAGRHRDDAQRDGRHARAGHLSISRGRVCVRIQGLRGRYTRFLSDGLPLFGQQVGSLGLLQIPPMDLGRVEVIKGVASSLYGAGAMGGVVNLISRKAEADPEREFLFNRSTRGATDAVAWYAAPLSPRWGLTMLGGGHWQQQTDVDDDTWADLPRYSRGVLRPRLSWDGGNGRTFFFRVKPFLKGHKNDYRDAEAIAEAVQRPTMSFVAIKTPEGRHGSGGPCIGCARVWSANARG